MATPFIYPFRDGLGVERFRVEFICESAAEAIAVSQRGASAPIAAAFLPKEPPSAFDPTGQVCIYPACNCPFDAPADPEWCARGYPHGRPTPTAGEFQATRQHEAAEGGEQSPCLGGVCGIGD